MLIVLALVGALACDGNHDGRTTVGEVLAGVNAVLDGDPCGDCATCGDACSEFPEAVIDGQFIVCQASFCFTTYERMEACVRQLNETPGVCVAVP